MQITIKTTPEAVRTLVPVPLKPNPENEIIIEIGAYDPGMRFNSVSLYVPASYGNTEGHYVAAIFLDYSFLHHKIPNGANRLDFEADIRFVRNDDCVESKVGIAGEHFIEATMNVEKQTDLCSVLSSKVLFHLNSELINNNKVNQLISTKVREYSIRRMEIGTATLQLSSFPFYRIGEIPILAIISANYIKESCMLGEAEILHNYPATATSVSLFQRPNLPGNAITVSQNYPNPFNPSTTFTYSIFSEQYVQIRIYNTLGIIVSTLVDEFKPAGEYIVQWNGRNELQQEVSSGLYFYQIKAGKEVVTKQMFKIK